MSAPTLEQPDGAGRLRGPRPPPHAPAAGRWRSCWRSLAVGAACLARLVLLRPRGPRRARGRRRGSRWRRPCSRRLRCPWACRWRGSTPARAQAAVLGLAWVAIGGGAARLAERGGRRGRAARPHRGPRQAVVPSTRRGWPSRRPPCPRGCRPWLPRTSGLTAAMGVLAVAAGRHLPDKVVSLSATTRDDVDLRLRSGADGALGQCRAARSEGPGAARPAAPQGRRVRRHRPGTAHDLHAR